MAPGRARSGKRPGGGTSDGRKIVLAALALGSVSCVPTAATEAPSALAFVTEIPTAEQAAAAPGLRPAARVEEAAIGPAFRGRTALDSLRSLDCLAQAVYYEAASESEDGQRAVAQVVLNRVRHPAWPNSVCGVVYQGPMRAGGGCQFTFTCDGSLTRAPAGAAWTQARRIAAEALAGRAYAPVGQSTHYHTHAVSPDWAPRLRWTASIGAHIFYRLPGTAGETRAFAAAYSGREPEARPSMTMLRRPPAPVEGLAALFAPAAAGTAQRIAAPSVTQAAAEAPASAQAPSTVREAYRQSGQWRDDAPAAITGR